MKNNQLIFFTLDQNRSFNMLSITLCSDFAVLITVKFKMWILMSIVINKQIQLITKVKFRNYFIHLKIGMELANETTQTVFNAYEYERGLGQSNPVW